MIIQLITVSVILILTIIVIVNELRDQKNRDYNEEMLHLLSEKVDKLIKKLT